MTSGEKMVWTAAFVAALDRGASGEDSATYGAAAVNVLRKLSSKLPAGSDVRAMVDDMITEVP
jgi:hypothetical protein